MTEEPLPRRDVGRTLPQAEALVYLQGLEDGERTRHTRTRTEGWAPGPDSTEPGDDVLDATEDDEALRAQHRRGERTLAVIEAATLRVEERLVDLDAYAVRLEACVRSAEQLVHALGGRPGYGPPRQALSARDRAVADELGDDLEDVDRVFARDGHFVEDDAPEAGEGDPQDEPQGDPPEHGDVDDHPVLDGPDPSSAP